MGVLHIHKLLDIVVVLSGLYISARIYCAINLRQSVVRISFAVGVMSCSNYIGRVSHKCGQLPGFKEDLHCLLQRICFRHISGPHRIFGQLRILCSSQSLFLKHISISPHSIMRTSAVLMAIPIHDVNNIIVQYRTGKVKGAFRVIAILVSGCRITKSGLISPLLDTSCFDFFWIGEKQIVIPCRNRMLNTLRQRLDISIHIRRNCGCIALFRLCFRLAGSDLRERSAHHIFKIANQNNCDLRSGGCSART